MKTILHFKTLVFKKTIPQKLKLPDKNYRTSIISLAILCLLMIVPLHINAQELSTYRISTR